MRCCLKTNASVRTNLEARIQKDYVKRANEGSPLKGHPLLKMKKTCNLIKTDGN